MTKKKDRYRRSDGYTEIALVQFARDHLFAAEKLFHLGVRTLDSAAYLAQLGIEILLKALLLSATDEFPQEHSLLKLGCEVKKAIPSFEIAEPYSDVLPLLNRYYYLRYPAPSNVPGVTQGDWPVIKHIVDLIERHLPEQVRHSPDTSSADKKAGRKIIRGRVTTSHTALNQRHR
jgi:HEPN domain-containing protein